MVFYIKSKQKFCTVLLTVVLLMILLGGLGLPGWGGSRPRAGRVSDGRGGAGRGPSGVAPTAGTGRRGAVEAGMGRAELWGRPRVDHVFSLSQSRSPACKGRRQPVHSWGSPRSAAGEDEPVIGIFARLGPRRPARVGSPIGCPAALGFSPWCRFWRHAERLPVAVQV